MGVPPAMRCCCPCCVVAAAGLDSPGGDIGLAPAPALAHIATGSVGGEGSQGGQCGADTTGAGAGPRVGSGEGTSLSEALGCAQSRLAGLRGEPRMPSTLGESSQGGQAAEAEDMNVDSAEPEGAAALPPTSGAGSSSSISSHLAQLCARLPGVVPAPPPTSTEPGGSRGGTSISASSSHDWWLTAPIVAFNTNGQSPFAGLACSCLDGRCGHCHSLAPM